MSRAPTCEDLMPHHKQGRSWTATGYGSKIPNATKVQYLGRWRRVYTTIYSNIGTSWISVKGTKHIVRDARDGTIEVDVSPWV
jgi:hypothetical protein